MIPPRQEMMTMRDVWLLLWVSSNIPPHCPIDNVSREYQTESMELHYFACYNSMYVCLQYSHGARKGIVIPVRVVAKPVNERDDILLQRELTLPDLIRRQSYQSIHVLYHWQEVLYF